MERFANQLSPELRQQLIVEISKNADLFAWSSADMPGIDPNLIYHRLAIHIEAKYFKRFLATPPVLQRPDRRSALLLYLVIAEEAISTVIVQERHKEQIPIYFISRVL
uniref:Reverse transcriptase/retrotransposon-derived protein RNase H-like domain-containing protein n=1 Tax=Cajanus cajan TaxID=3821 RepID=A0A151T928_CAJCA|nr:hypothetical protein KK1_018125 [Cajanus cajan]